jgi:hypothetical protein
MGKRLRSVGNWILAVRSRQKPLIRIKPSNQPNQKLELCALYAPNFLRKFPKPGIRRDKQETNGFERGIGYAFLSFFRQNFGNDPLIPVSSSYFIPSFDFTFLEESVPRQASSNREDKKLEIQLQGDRQP